MASLAKRLDAIEPMILAQAGQIEKSVYGIVDRVDNINGELVPHCVRKWKGTIGNMHSTLEEPTIHLIEKLEPFILKHKKYKCMFGGRAGTKSRMAQDCCAGEVNSEGSKIYVLRERMKSLKESIYAGIESSIKMLSFAGFRSVPSHWEIRHKTGGKFTFGGMLNILDMKGASNYKIFLMEEAAKTAQKTIDTLGPTLRDTKNAELWYLWNPESSTDPMSKEFVTPYQSEIDRDGYFEDDYHLIIKVSYKDNPWFKHDESLYGEFMKDTDKMNDGRMSKARYNHIWNGDFNDDVETSVIQADWFDACIDAHKKLGFEAKGGKVASFDPSDIGNDPAGYAQRQGVVFDCIEEIEAADGNKKCDVACLKALNYGADAFGWDGDGMGALLRTQIAKSFDNTKTHLFLYKGSSAVHHPNAIFESENTAIDIKAGRLNKDVFKNKKAQNITAFAERVFKTYEAVIHGKYHNPDDLVSFDSSKIKPNMLKKLRAEACKTPLKPADSVCFYTKEELRRGVLMPDGSRLKIPSPNLFDAVVLSKDKASIINKIDDTPVNFKTCY